MLTLLASIPAPPDNMLHVGPIGLHIYGLCIALGVIASVSLARRRWGKLGGNPDDITSVAIVAIPAGLIGARIYHVVTDFPDLYSNGRWFPNAFYIWNGGLGIPGGVVGGALAALLMARRYKMNWRAMADVTAPALPIAQAIGRFGNYFNQELFGGPTKLPWGLKVDAAHVPAGYPLDTLFHPTFLYESLWNFSLAGLIVLVSRKLVLKPGRWFAVYVLGYGVGRLWVESLRIDTANEILGLRVNTWTSGLAILGGLVWLFWRGSPIDREATAELRAGGDPQGQLASPPATAEADASAEEAGAHSDDSADPTATSDVPGDHVDDAAASPAPAEVPDAHPDDPGSPVTPEPGVQAESGSGDQ